MQRLVKILTAAFTTTFLIIAAITTSSALDIKWKAPIDNIDAWVGSTGDIALDSDECWLDAKVENGALVVNENERCRVFYPYVKVKDSQKGLFEAEEGDALNFNATFDTDESSDNAQAHNFGLVLTFAAKNSDGINIDVNVNKAIALADDDINISESGNLLAGTADVSIDLAAAVRRDTTKEDYETIYGENGDSTVIAVRLYIATGEYAPETKLTLRRLSITSGVGGADSDTNESFNSTASMISGGTSAESFNSSITTNSSVPQVDTGESIAPIFSVAVLAAAAIYTIAVTKKRAG